MLNSSIHFLNKQKIYESKSVGICTHPVQGVAGLVLPWAAVLLLHSLPGLFFVVDLPVSFEIKLWPIPILNLESVSLLTAVQRLQEGYPKQTYQGVMAVHLRWHHYALGLLC